MQDLGKVRDQNSWIGVDKGTEMKAKSTENLFKKILADHFLNLTDI